MNAYSNTGGYDWPDSILTHTNINFMGCTTQLVQHVALQQDEKQRARFMCMAEVHVYDSSVLHKSDCD